jgi:hypothetical protein
VRGSAPLVGAALAAERSAHPSAGPPLTEGVRRSPRARAASARSPRRSTTLPPGFGGQWQVPGGDERGRRRADACRRVQTKAVVGLQFGRRAERSPWPAGRTPVRKSAGPTRCIQRVFPKYPARSMPGHGGQNGTLLPRPAAGAAPTPPTPGRALRHSPSARDDCNGRTEPRRMRSPVSPSAELHGSPLAARPRDKITS